MEGSMGQLDTWDTFCGWWALVTPIVRMGLSTCWEPPSHSPLGYVFRNWKILTLKMLKRLRFFCNKTWGQYKLGNEEKWLLNGTLNYSIILQLDLFYHSLHSNLYGTQSESRPKGFMLYIYFCWCPILSFPPISPFIRSPSPGLSPIRIPF